MSSVKNIRGNKKSQKPNTPQASNDIELGLNPEPEPETSPDDGIVAVLAEREDEIISPGNQENERVKKVVKQLPDNSLKEDKTVLESENKRVERQNSLNQERKTESPQHDEDYSETRVSQILHEDTCESHIDDITGVQVVHKEQSEGSESSPDEIYDKPIFDIHLSKIITILSEINNKFMRGRTNTDKIQKLRKIEKKSKFIYDNFKLLKKNHKDYSANIVLDLKNELNDLKDNLYKKTKENRKSVDYFFSKIDHLYDKFKEKNIDQIEDIKNNDLKMNIKHEREFDGHLEKKLTFLTERLDLLQMKYNGYKQWYDRMNITIIIISTVLSVFESFRLEVDDMIPENNHNLRLFFNMTPIAISSTITCAAAIIKFKKYQEKMENMQFTREKVITSISRIEHVKESLWFNEGDDDFHEIKLKYLSEVFTTYNESIAELKRHIKFNDPHKFDKRVNDNNKENYKNKNMYI